MAKYEIDYKQSIENLMQVIKNRADEERTYFDLQKQLNELSGYGTVVGKHIYDINMTEQIPLLSMLLQTSKYYKYLCEKYGWEDEVEELDCED